VTDPREQYAAKRAEAGMWRMVGLQVDWQGTWWPKPGSICADGSIVGSCDRSTGDVSLVTSGLVYIDQRRLPAALRLGWTWRGDTAPDGLAMVWRA
jgi:hypothetical protein